VSRFFFVTSRTVVGINWLRVLQLHTGALTTPICWKTEVLTLKEYQGFQRAYDFFNRELVAGSLPQVLVTLQRHANTRGYFAPLRFKGRIDKQSVHELALNPDNFTGRSDELILSTLTHEMCHVWQETYGEPSRRGYHNRQWARKMREVGLQPTSTGEPGGMETGQAVTHFILPEGRYARAYAQLSDSGYQLHWQSIPASGGKSCTLVL
jgi:hypothetical protein